MSDIDLESREFADVDEGDVLEIVYEIDGEEHSATVTVINDDGDRPIVETDDNERYIFHTQNRRYTSPVIIPLGQRGGYDLLSATVVE